MKKVTIIGAGNVGATAGLILAKKLYCKIALIDKFDDMAKAKAIDMKQGFDADIEGSGDFSMMKGSDVIVITAGIPRKPGMTRDDLVKTNMAIMDEISKEIEKYAKDAIKIVVSNPMDVLANYLGKKLSNVIGMGGVLDCMRFTQKIQKRMPVSAKEISTMVLGEHGESMVPVPEYTTVKGIPITKLFKKTEIESIIEETKQGGLEIVKLLKQGSAFYAPGKAISLMVESVLFDQKRVVCACAPLKGEYGINGLLIGVPVILGKNGVEKVLELDLSEETMKRFKESVEALMKKNA
jgi:malate dehydrogenase